MAYRPVMPSPSTELEVGDRTVRISNPDRVYFPERGETKLDLARYYLAVGDGIVRALRERPCMLHRYPDGVSGEKIYQKRLPKGAPDWVETATVRFPSGRSADELCVTELASVIWAVQMSTVEFHPWHSRRADTEQPDELRIDLDPQPGTGLAEAKQVAAVVHEVLDELGAVGWPKTSGSRGLHIYVRIEPAFGFREVRRVEMDDFTIATMPARFAELGDLHAGIDDAVWSIEPLLEWADRDERDHGLGDMPYPPNFPKMEGEPPRVQPSRMNEANWREDGPGAVEPSDLN